MCVCLVSHVQSFATSWTIAHQAPLVHEDSSGKNIGTGSHALLQGIFPTQGSNPGSLIADSLLSESPGKPRNVNIILKLSVVCGLILSVRRPPSNVRYKREKMNKWG